MDKNHLLPWCGYNNEAGCQGAVFLLAYFLIQLYFELWLCITLHRIYIKILWNSVFVLVVIYLKRLQEVIFLLQSKECLTDLQLWRDWVIFRRIGWILRWILRTIPAIFWITLYIQTFCIYEGKLFPLLSAYAKNLVMILWD